MSDLPYRVEYACALLIRDRQILLGLRAVHRRSWPCCWDIIGGHLEAGEAASTALIRELQEEIGITPTEFHYFDCIETTEFDGVTPARWHLFTVTEWTGGEPAIANDEHSQLKWFRFEEAESLTALASEAYRPVFARLSAATLPRPGQKVLLLKPAAAAQYPTRSR
ncbi:NUDIX hydrolase [Microvirga rosea]|uniref:NUDIX hydrolase n=1 Tax=Microvirga rosea TaxID=2715425 RepID=UPI001D0A7D93|nr:NUDIX domain-containing protein [Microvirga rosea]MCB8823296.1 NUDIX domain-containing protein [Microvirga rosea]